MKNYISILILIFSISVSGQVTKRIIVEHFTNTVCSVCAVKNPDLYTNLNDYTEIKHIAYHPSSPYSSCVLNQHNTLENDGRTNYYNIYGATPRLTIQGEVQSVNVNFNDVNLFFGFINQTSPVSIRMNQTKYLSDSIVVEVWIKTEAMNAFTDVNLVLGLAEDTAFYNSPNGETEHYDVFRKMLNGINGTSLILPLVGDSIGFTFTSTVHQGWDISRIFSYVILQNNTNKEIVQSSYVLADGSEIPLGLNEEMVTVPLAYPNPTEGVFMIDFNGKKFNTIEVTNLLGERIIQQSASVSKVNLVGQPAGVYLVTLLGKQTSKVIKVVKR